MSNKVKGFVRKPNNVKGIGRKPKTVSILKGALVFMLA